MSPPVDPAKSWDKDDKAETGDEHATKDDLHRMVAAKSQFKSDKGTGPEQHGQNQAEKGQ